MFPFRLVLAIEPAHLILTFINLISLLLAPSWYQIWPTHDIDSVIAVITTLAVHRVAIQINYKPLYFSQVRQNPHVTFRENNAKIHWTKNAFLG
jgi:hypothetical protein